MDETTLEALERNYPGLYDQHHGHEYHHEADTNCQGEEIHVSNKDKSIDFIVCSECGEVTGEG